MAKEKDVEQTTLAPDPTEEVSHRENTVKSLQAIAVDIRALWAYNTNHLQDHPLTVSLEDIEQRVNASISRLQTA